MTVDAVEARVEHAVAEPLGEGGVAPVEDLGERRRPVKFPGLVSPETESVFFCACREVCGHGGGGREVVAWREGLEVFQEVFDLVSHHRSFRVIAIRHRLIAAQRASSLRSQHVPRLPPFGGIGEGLTAHRVVRLGQEVNRDLCQTSRILCHPDGHSLGVSRVKSVTRSVIPCGSAGYGRTFSIARGMDTFPDEICTRMDIDGFALCRNYRGSAAINPPERCMS